MKTLSTWLLVGVAVIVFGLFPAWVISEQTESKFMERWLIGSYNASDKVLEPFITEEMLHGASLEDYCRTVYPQYGYGEMLHQLNGGYVIRLSDRQSLNHKTIKNFYDLSKKDDAIYTVVFYPPTAKNLSCGY